MTDTPTDDSPAEVERADPATRWKAVSAVVVLLLLGIGMSVVLEPYLVLDPEPAKLEEELGRTLQLVWALTGTMLALSIGCSAWMFWFAGRIRRTRRYPPPGSSVVRDVRVLKGVDADRRARIIALLAWTLLAVTALFVLLTWQIVSALRGGLE